MSTVCLLLLSIVPPPPAVLVDTVDVAESNWFYDGEGKLVFQQLIWYTWQKSIDPPHDYRHEVVAWRLVKVPEILPVRDHATGLYRSTWDDSDGGLRTVYARSFRETWEQYDVELVEREFLPKDLRRELQKRPARVQSRP